jgi:hypothetical protein
MAVREAAIFSEADTMQAERAAVIPRPVVIAAAICGIVGITAWVFYVSAFSGDFGQDWMVFYTAGQAWLDGNLPLIFDGAQLIAGINQRFAGWLTFTLNLHPWVYPPTFLMLFLPFALLPPVLSLTVFLLVGFVAAVVAVAGFLQRGIGRWVAGFSLVLCPAVAFNVTTGQNAFFTTSLLVGGFSLIARSPVLGGALLGVLTFKPQFWLMVPVALIAARRWRALASAIAVALLLVLASTAVIGVDAWRAWIDLMTGANDLFRAWTTAGRINGLSIYACATLLGAPSAVANLAQATAVGFAAICVYWAFHHRVVGPLQLAVLLAATIFAAPHASASDAVLLAVATSLFISAMLAGEFRLAPFFVAAAVWIWPLFNPPSLFRAGLLTPILVLMFLGCALAAIGERDSAAPART